MTLDFPRYSGYSIQARWANVQADDVKFSQDLTHQKSLKSVNFWQSYLKNKKVDVFWGHSVEAFSQIVRLKFLFFFWLCAKYNSDPIAAEIS